MSYGLSEESLNNLKKQKKKISNTKVYELTTCNFEKKKFDTKNIFTLKYKMVLINHKYSLIIH